MAIRQQVRPDAPHPEVHETDYGAKFVKASTETKENETVDLTSGKEEATEPDLKPVEAETAATEEKPRKKKGGRPKKK